MDSIRIPHVDFIRTYASCGLYHICMNTKWIPNGFHVGSIATAAVASACVCVCDRDTECESEHKRMHEYERVRERETAAR